jgi:two-component system NtrC family response regulator
VLREDLFYRLNVIPIHLPPLRERRDDIPFLIAHFIEKVSAAQGKPVRTVTPEALALLEGHQWPGNIRELANVIERAIVLGSGSVIDVDVLPADLRQPSLATDLPVEVPPSGLDLEATLARIEQRYIEIALARTSGVQTRAAELLKVSFRQFRYKLRKHSLRAISRSGGPG